MTSKSMAYDNPAYQAVDTHTFGSIAASANSASNKYASYAARYIKSVMIRPTTAPAAAGDVISLIQVSGTTTTTTALATFGTSFTSGTFSQIQPASGTGSLGNAVSGGDIFYVVKGTDTASVYLGEIESVLQPGANVTQ